MTGWRGALFVLGFSLLAAPVSAEEKPSAPLQAVQDAERIDVPSEPELGGHFVFHWPLEEVQVNSGFGMRRDPVKRSKKSKARLHAGIDLDAETGDTVLATGPGRVLHAGWSSGYGNYVLIQHENGYRSHYAHLSEVQVYRGQLVRQGAPIGLAGSTGHSTGPHLHFGISRDGIWMNPLKLIGHETANGTKVEDADALRGEE